MRHNDINEFLFETKFFPQKSFGVSEASLDQVWTTFSFFNCSEKQTKQHEVQILKHAAMNSYRPF